MKLQQETVEACSGGSPHAARGSVAKKGLSVGVGCTDFYLPAFFMREFLFCLVIVIHGLASALSGDPAHRLLSSWDSLFSPWCFQTAFSSVCSLLPILEPALSLSL